MSSLVTHSFLQPTFWSYRLSDLDTEQHKELIIKQILNSGNKAAIDWLRSTYTPEDIKRVIEASMISEWSKKSLALWTAIYNVTPSRQSRFA